MYYPYLRGKQFELIALREFANAYENYKVVPIVEPIKNTFNSMIIAIDIMKKKDLRFALILNPQVGEIIDEMSIIENSLKEQLKEWEKWYPTFIVTNNNHNTIIEHIDKKRYKNVFLICKDNIDTSISSLDALFKMEAVTNVVINASSSHLKRIIQKTQKNIIRLDDNFNSQRKNSDYLNVTEEMFTEEYKFYKEDGYCGISDYTVLPSEFIDGGMLPWAVAIHWTYEKNNNSIWIKHFVSDNNNGTANIQGKFLEAGKKAVEFFNSNNLLHTNSIKEMREFVEKQQYPGLGVIKKMSIKNHIELLQLILAKM